MPDLSAATGMLVSGFIVLIIAGVIGMYKNKDDYDQEGERGFFMDYTYRERWSALKHPVVYIPYIIGLILIFGSFAFL